MDVARLEEGETTIMTISKLKFNVRAPYREADVLNGNDAGQLNQTFREGIRNNKASQVLKMIAEGRSHKDIQQMITDYEVDYVFGTRGAGGVRSSDPVETEARRLARGMVKQAIQKAGKVFSNYGGDQINTMITLAIENHPSITEQAEINVEAQRVATEDVLASLEVPEATPAEETTEAATA